MSHRAMSGLVWSRILVALDVSIDALYRRESRWTAKPLRRSANDSVLGSRLLVLKSVSLMPGWWPAISSITLLE